MVLAQRDHESESPARNRFPSHYGSRSTRSWTDGIFSRLELFPSHYGSRSTIVEQLSLDGLYSFPSHIGSRSTRGANSPAQDSALRFHPTLVLAQLERLERLGYIEFGFPSHIGSRSTEASHKTALEILVSIPHWFSLNTKNSCAWV